MFQSPRQTHLMLSSDDRYIFSEAYPLLGHNFPLLFVTLTYDLPIQFLEAVRFYNHQHLNLFMHPALVTYNS